MTTKTDETLDTGEAKVYFEGWGDYVNIIFPHTWVKRPGSRPTQIRMTRIEARDLRDKLNKLFWRA